MRPGTRLVLLCLAFGAIALTLFIAYGRRAERGADSPLAAARALVGADNTAVGRLGGLRSVAPLDDRPGPEGGRSLAVAVTGGRLSGTLYADLVRERGRWVVRRAALDLPRGERLPLRGPRPSLAPVSHRTAPPQAMEENR